MASASAATIQDLRARIREIEGFSGGFSPIVRLREPSGLPGLDAILGGLPRPGLVELVGAPGSGRARVAAAVAAARVARRHEVAWVDGDSVLYPPGLARLGVDLDHVLVVRPPADGTPGAVWAAEQILRSGCFSLVVIQIQVRAETPRRFAADPDGRAETPRRFAADPRAWCWGGLARAAEHGGCTGLVLSTGSSRDLPADLRLAVGDGRLTVLRDRSGRAGAEVEVPPWPEEADPWA
jgi:hypothetical protein